MMQFLIVLAVTTFVVVALRKPITRYPIVFYAIAVCMVIAFIAGTTAINNAVWRQCLLIMRRCLIPTALFAIVMFIGAFSRDSKVGLWLRPVRSELSIIAWILCMGHVCAFLPTYFNQLVGGNLPMSTTLSILVALVLFVLLLVLGVTSFNAVKRHMKTSSWIKLQKLAYVFFGLVYVHLMLMLVPSALQGALQARQSVVLYTVLFGTYAIMRIRRAVIDRRQKRQEIPS